MTGADTGRRCLYAPATRDDCFGGCAVSLGEVRSSRSCLRCRQRQVPWLMPLRLALRQPLAGHPPCRWRPAARRHRAGHHRPGPRRPLLVLRRVGPRLATIRCVDVATCSTGARLSRQRSGARAWCSGLVCTARYVDWGPWVRSGHGHGRLAASRRRAMATMGPGGWASTLRLTPTTNRQRPSTKDWEALSPPKWLRSGVRRHSLEEVNDSARQEMPGAAVRGVSPLNPARGRAGNGDALH